MDTSALRYSFSARCCWLSAAGCLEPESEGSASALDSDNEEDAAGVRAADAAREDAGTGAGAGEGGGDASISVLASAAGGDTAVDLRRTWSFAGSACMRDAGAVEGDAAKAFPGMTAGMEGCAGILSPVLGSDDVAEERSAGIAVAGDAAGAGSAASLVPAGPPADASTFPEISGTAVVDGPCNFGSDGAASALAAEDCIGLPSRVSIFRGSSCPAAWPVPENKRNNAQPLTPSRAMPSASATHQAGWRRRFSGTALTCCPYSPLPVPSARRASSSCSIWLIRLIGNTPSPSCRRRCPALRLPQQRPKARKTHGSLRRRCRSPRPGYAGP